MLTATALSRKLRSQAKPESVAILQRFFKTGPGEYGEGDRFMGVALPVIRSLASSAARRSQSCRSFSAHRCTRSARWRW